MAYTNIWNENRLTGAEAANTIATLINAVRVDVQDRLQDIFQTPDFTVDPLRLYGLKFTDAQDSIFNLGDNAGTPRNLIIKNKAGSTTYYTLSSTGFTIQPTTAIGLQISTLINNTAGLQFHQAGVQDWSIGNIASSGNFVINNGSNFGGSNYLTLTPGGAFQIIGSLQITSNVAAPAGGIGKSASQGLVISGVTGSTNDLLLTNASGQNVLSIPTGTINAFFANSLTVANGLTINAAGVNITGGILINTGGLTVSAGNTSLQALSITGQITSTQDGRQYLRTGASTGTQYFDLSNTGGRLLLGVEASFGGQLLVGSTGYATVLTTVGATVLQLGTNQGLALTIGTNLAVTFGGLGKAIILNSATTTYSAIGIANTSGSILIGVLSSTGGGAFGGPGNNYAGFIGTDVNQPLDFFTNSTRRGGFSAAGIFDVNNGLTVSASGINVTGGITVVNVGITVTNGGISVNAGGLSVSSGGIVCTNGSITLGSGAGLITNQATLIFIGGSVNTNFNNAANNATNLTISDNGSVIIRNGLTISASGINVTGGISIVSGGLVATGQTLVAAISNMSTGFQIGSAAPTGNFLRGNGTNFVAATISTADLPTLDTVRAYKSAASQTLSQNTLTAISFDAEDYDTNTMHDNVTNNSRLTAQTSGKYKITAHIGWTGVASNVFIIIRKNGVATNLAETFLTVTSTSVGTTEVNCTLSLAAADYVEVYGQGDNVTPTILNNQERTYFEMQKLTA